MDKMETLVKVFNRINELKGKMYFAKPSQSFKEDMQIIFGYNINIEFNLVLEVILIYSGDKLLATIKIIKGKKSLRFKTKTIEITMDSKDVPIALYENKIYNYYFYEFITDIEKVCMPYNLECDNEDNILYMKYYNNLNKYEVLCDEIFSDYIDIDVQFIDNYMLVDNITYREF